MPADSVIHLPVISIQCSRKQYVADRLAAEEPLEIRLISGASNDRKTRQIAVTMRTPGHDAELASGFLFTEGIIGRREELRSVAHRQFACRENRENIVEVELEESSSPDLRLADRNFFTTSSCGVCGKASIDAIRTTSGVSKQPGPILQVSADLLCALPVRLKCSQALFAETGGLHAAAIFDLQGQLLALREDVGRHNALDKLIGYALNAELLPLNQHVLLLSGRASFELVQKAAMAGVQLIAAVGAPSSLSVQLAEEFGITLVGFLREQRFNIYTGGDRIIIHQDENSY